MFERACGARFRAYFDVLVNMLATEKITASCAGFEWTKAKRRDRGNCGPNPAGTLLGLRNQATCAAYAQIRIQGESSFTSAESEELLLFNLQNCPFGVFRPNTLADDGTQIDCGLRCFSSVGHFVCCPAL